MNSSLVPLWFYGRSAQWKCSICLGLFCSIVGGFLVSKASGIKEVSIPYDHSHVCTEDTPERCFITFAVDEDIPQPVYMYYEIPQIFTNHKSYLESKDNDIFGSVYSIYKCDNLETTEQAKTKRGFADTQFQQLIEAGGQDIRPCGFTALSLFTDTYAIYEGETKTVCQTNFDKGKCDAAEGCVWDSRTSDEAGVDIYNRCGYARVVNLDQSEVALPADEEIIKASMVDANREKDFPVEQFVKGSDDTLHKSWLRKENAWMQHFLVWMRSPASPHIRNLWAVIREGPGFKDGLVAGTYTLHIIHNSPIWTQQWLVPEKRIVLSTATAMGGNSTFLGLTMVILGVYCFGSAVFFLVAPKNSAQVTVKKPSVAANHRGVSPLSIPGSDTTNIPMDKE